MSRWRLLHRVFCLSFRVICAQRSAFLGLPLLPETILSQFSQISCGFAAAFHVGSISKALKARQKEVDPKIAAYSDRANERLKRKYYRIALHSKHNIAKTAAARELACFMWGMMTGNYA